MSGCPAVAANNAVESCAERGSFGQRQVDASANEAASDG
jgi:hypothetical protein